MKCGSQPEKNILSSLSSVFQEPLFQLICKKVQLSLEKCDWVSYVTERILKDIKKVNENPVCLYNCEKKKCTYFEFEPIEN